jgi:hypothetical protein
VTENPSRREWREKGRLNRLDGHFEYPDGRREWRGPGPLHRLDGPAVEYPDGRREWWVHGRYFSGGAAMSAWTLDALYDNAELRVLEAVLDLWRPLVDLDKLVAAVRAAQSGQQSGQ